MPQSDERTSYNGSGKIEIQLEQARTLNRWILGLLATLIVFAAGWMIKMSDDIANIRVEQRTSSLLAEVTKTSVQSLSEQATTGLRIGARAEEAIKAIEFRLAGLETEKAKGGRFTTEDGNRLTERVRILEEELNRGTRQKR